MKKLRLSILLAISLITLNTFGQAGMGKIQGHVYSPDKQAAVYSTVVLMNIDSVFMKGALSADDGSFKFDKLGTDAPRFHRKSALNMFR